MSTPLKAATIVATLLLGTSAAQSQILYTTDFGTGSTAATDGYTYTQEELTQGETKTGTTVSGTGQNGWLTNDPDNSATATSGAYIGGSNFVGSTGYFTGYSAYVGGAQRSTTASSDVVPGAATTYLYHPFALASAATQGYQFGVDFAVTASTGSFTAQDTFAFTLRNAAGNNLLSVSFAPTTSAGAASSGRDGIGYSLGTSTTITNPSNNGILLNTQYHLTIQVNPTANTFSAFLSNGTIIATNIGLSGQISATSVTQADATWTLSNQTTDAAGAYENAGNNVLVFDNYAVSYVNLVPEPSTYAMFAVGVLGTISLLKHRRRHS